MEEPELSWKNSTRKSKRKSKIVSFMSYFTSEGNSDSFISPPTNFEKIEFTNDSVSPHVSIQECPFDVTGYGCLLMKNKFQLKLNVQRKKKKNVVVFMFERIIVFTMEKEKDSFYYLGSINISDLSIAPPSKPTKLLLNDFKKSKLTHSNVEYTLKSKNKELIFAWRTAIQNCLWKELIVERDNTLERFRSIQQIPEFRDLLPHL